MTTIRTVSNQGEAAFLVSLLRGNEFEAVLLGEGAFQYSCVMEPMRIQVPDEQAEEARSFLRSTPELKPNFTYSDDGAANSDQAV